MVPRRFNVRRWTSLFVPRPYYQATRSHVHVIFVHLPVNMFVAATQHAFQHPCLRVYDFVGLFTTSSSLDRARVSCASLQHSCPIYKRATTPRRGSQKKRGEIAVERVVSFPDTGSGSPPDLNSKFFGRDPSSRRSDLAWNRTELIEYKTAH